MFSRTLLFILILIASYPVIAIAQEPVSIEYTELIDQALIEYRAKRWDEARTLFRKAHEINPNARTLRGIGVTSFRKRDYVNTIKYLEQALGETRRALSEEQRLQVQEFLTRAKRFVGRLKIDLIPSDARLSIDGISRELDENELLVNPGKVELVAEAEGYETLRRSIEVRSDRKDIIELSLVPISQSEGETLSGSINTDEQEGSSSIVPYIVMGSGGALLIGSAVTGLLSYSAEQELDDACDSENQCLEKYKSTRDRGEALQVVSFVLLGAGVATAAAGVVLLLLEGSGEEAVETPQVSLGCGSDGCVGLIRSIF